MFSTKAFHVTLNDPCSQMPVILAVSHRVSWIISDSRRHLPSYNSVNLSVFHNTSIRVNSILSMTHNLRRRSEEEFKGCGVLSCLYCFICMFIVGLYLRSICFWELLLYTEEPVRLLLHASILSSHVAIRYSLHTFALHWKYYCWKSIDCSRLAMLLSLQIQSRMLAHIENWLIDER